MNTTGQQYSRHVSVPSNEGIRIDKVITIDRPVQEVYSFWRRLENLPRFLRHVQSVTVQDNLHSHWIIRGNGGKRLEWDAETIEQKENEMFSWRSAPGADVDNAGSVWFTPVPGGQGTVVRLELKYIPPEGKTGGVLTKLFGQDAEPEIEEDLNRLKSLLETGSLPETGKKRVLKRTLESTRQVANNTTVYIRQNPWKSIACFAMAGFALGFLLARPSNRTVVECEVED